jgi:hypothetical protein
MSYGTRYLELGQFIRYCEELNVTVDKRELEYYEEKGVMLPVARVVVPEEYVKRMHEWQYRSTDMPYPDEWPEINRLRDRHLVLLEDYAKLTDEELVDPFDREFGRNPYLVRPDLNNYQSWDSYQVVVEHHDDYDVKESAATPYYSYWQVHQLYEIQKYPDLYKNRFLIEHLPDEFRERCCRALNLELYRSFHGRAPFFDALSFYITMYNREHNRTFALIPEQYRVRTLNAQQYQAYQSRLRAHAESVVAKYSLAEQDLYAFLVNLLDLHHSYLKAERLKLADELENDIVYQARLIAGKTGKEWKEVADELGKIPPFWSKQAFRHLNPILKERDGARELLLYCMKMYSEEMVKMNVQAPVCSLSEGDLDELLAFCEDNGLRIFSFTLDEMIALHHLNIF